MLFETGSCESDAQLQLLEEQTYLNDTQWDAKQRAIFIKDRTIRLTPTQHRLLTPLQQGRPVTYAKLARLAYNCPLDENVRKTMDKQIDRIRTKLHGTGIYIYCVLKYGYVLLNEVPPED